MPSASREHGNPIYVYDADRLAANVRRLQSAFDRAEVPLKANRHPALLAVVAFCEAISIFMHKEPHSLARLV